MCLADEIKGLKQTQLIHMPESHHKPTHCSAKEGDRGANKFNKFMPERHQELELVFGQMIGGEHKHWSLSIIGEHKQSAFG
jgi:hypothetical protein